MRPRWFNRELALPDDQNGPQNGSYGRSNPLPYASMFGTDVAAGSPRPSSSWSYPIRDRRRRSGAAARGRIAMLDKIARDGASR